MYYFSKDIYISAVIYECSSNISAHIYYYTRTSAESLIVGLLHTLARAVCTAADDCATTPRAIVAVALVL